MAIQYGFIAMAPQTPKTNSSRLKNINLVHIGFLILTHP